MSTFPGILSEIPKISVDRFDGKNLTSEVFFLSHFHSDHMVGLRSTEFHGILRKKDSAFIYCSELTALFLLQNHLKGFDGKVKILSINKEHVINIGEEHGFVTVTPLPAGHCPGSVMFLFSFKQRNYLYTGDYRMTKKNIEEMKALRNHLGGFKPIETLYLDTTFFEQAYAYLPTRDESMMELIKFCRSWLEKGDDFVIDLRTPATIGVEYVMIALSKEFGQPLHVSDTAYEKYSRIPQLATAISKDDKSKLHACIPGHLRNGKSLFLKCHAKSKEQNVLSIKLCALHARKFSREKNLVSYSEQQGLYRLVYSSHSSQSELLEMIETLLPKKIEPCVVPINYTPQQVVEALKSNCELQFERSDSEDTPVLQFSSYEEVADSDSDSGEKCDSPRENEQSRALVTLSKYNVRESSDEDDCWRDDNDDDELPPFRWDCYYDASKALGFHRKERQQFKRQKLDDS